MFLAIRAAALSGLVASVERIFLSFRSLGRSSLLHLSPRAWIIGHLEAEAFLEVALCLLSLRNRHPRFPACLMGTRLIVLQHGSATFVTNLKVVRLRMRDSLLAYVRKSTRYGLLSVMTPLVLTLGASLVLSCVIATRLQQGSARTQRTRNLAGSPHH